MAFRRNEKRLSACDGLSDGAVGGDRDVLVHAEHAGQGVQFVACGAGRTSYAARGVVGIDLARFAWPRASWPVEIKLLSEDRGRVIPIGGEHGIGHQDQLSQRVRTRILTQEGREPQDQRPETGAGVGWVGVG